MERRVKRSMIIAGRDRGSILKINLSITVNFIKLIS